RDQPDPPPSVDGQPAEETRPPDGLLGDLRIDGVPERLSRSEIENEQDLGAPGRLEDLRLELARVAGELPVDTVEGIAGLVRTNAAEPFALLEDARRRRGRAERQAP